MLSNHLIALPPPSLLPSMRVFSSESALCIRWPKYWSFSFSNSPSNEYSGLISLLLTGLISLQETLKSSPTPQFESISSSVLSLLCGLTLTSVHATGKTRALTPPTLVGKVMSLLCISFSIVTVLSGFLHTSVHPLTRSYFEPMLCYKGHFRIPCECTLFPAGSQDCIDAQNHSQVLIRKLCSWVRAGCSLTHWNVVNGAQLQERRGIPVDLGRGLTLLVPPPCIHSSPFACTTGRWIQRRVASVEDKYNNVRQIPLILGQR